MNKFIEKISSVLGTIAVVAGFAAALSAGLTAFTEKFNEVVPKSKQNEG